MKTVRVFGFVMACSGLLLGCGVEDGATEDNLHNDPKSDVDPSTRADIQSLESDLPIADEQSAADTEELLAAPEVTGVWDWVRCQGFVGACFGSVVVTGGFCGSGLGLACVGAASAAVTYCAGAARTCGDAIANSEGATGVGRRLLVDLGTHVGNTHDAVKNLHNKPTAAEHKGLVGTAKALKDHIAAIKKHHGDDVDKRIDAYIAKGVAGARQAAR